MIIGIDASRAMRKQKTGVERYAYHVINELVKFDSKNQYVLYTDQKPDEWLTDLAKKSNVTVKHLRWPFKFLWTQARLSGEMFFHPPEVLFISASALPVIHPKNTVTAIHDVGFMETPESYSRRQRLYLRWSTKFAVRRAKKIITISEFSQKAIARYFNAAADKVQVIYPGYDKESFNTEKPNTEAVLKKYNIKPPYVLYVGRLEKKKNIEVLIKALAVSKQSPSSGRYQLVLAGGKGYGWEDTQRIIRQNNLESDIVVTGYVSENDLSALYHGAAIFIFPSRYEGFGLPVLEAFACGTPVICSRAGSLPEIAGEAAVFFDVNDWRTLAEKVSEVLTNESLRQNLTYEGTKRVKLFSWERCGRKIWEELTIKS